MTHDYKRNGTTTLFVALNVKTGELIGECLPRHRAKEFIRFLKTIERTVTKHLDLHLIVDNYTTHKTKEAQAWLAKHPRFKLHFTPTSSSWLNLVERFFAEITGKRIPARNLPKPGRTGGRHLGLSRQTQCRTQTLRLDKD
jgi:transposase